MSETLFIRLLPEDIKIPAVEGKMLLQQLTDQGVFLRADCGGAGKCGKCKVKKYQEDGTSRIIVAGAFGSYLNKADMTTLGKIPNVAQKDLSLSGNAAGAGVIMALCDPEIFEEAARISKKIKQLIWPQTACLSMFF